MVFLTQWYLHAACFFLSTECGIVQLRTTLLLSPRRRAGSSGSTPIKRRVFLYSKMSSVATLVATNSEPYVEVSTVFCLCEMALTGVLFRNNNTPVTDLLVTKSCA